MFSSHIRDGTEDSHHQHHLSVFLCTASDLQCATSSSSARSTHAGPNTRHHQVGPMQLSSCGYLGISAGPTAVRAECCRSACLLASDIGTHDSTAPGAALVTRTGANPVPVVCSGVSLCHLCASHSTSVSNLKACGWHPKSSVVAVYAVDSPTLLVPSTRESTLGDRAFPVAAARA